MASEVEGDSEVLFATDIVNNVVKLKNVILNEFHILRKFSFIRCSFFPHWPGFFLLFFAKNCHCFEIVFRLGRSCQLSVRFL